MESEIAKRGEENRKFMDLEEKRNFKGGTEQKLSLLFSPA